MKSLAAKGELTIAERLPQSGLGAARHLGVSAVTLFHTPPHKTLHKDVENITREACDFQPLQPDISEVENNLHLLLAERQADRKPSHLSSAQLIHLFGTLIQFSDHTHLDSLPISYPAIEKLKQGIQAQALESGPLSLDQQLDVSLAQTDNDLFESVWRLFLASRHYARWLDNRLVGETDLSDEQKLEQMIQWRQSIASYKLPEHGNAQDTSGDNYYAWTHALALAAIKSSDAAGSLTGDLMRGLFSNGTSIMHTVVHHLNKQAVPNNHSQAAAYGNMAGRVIASYLAGGDADLKPQPPIPTRL